ncbi:MAG: SDR family oxidoreductase [Candidatus Nitrosopolaris sp.]|jgi:NAD(P)-dependent dehydrogenase (short-subunit alcohol dehydrogenase family)
MMSMQKDKEQQEKVAVVTGSSSGIGQEIALKLARNDFLTYATMRNPKKGEYLKSLADKEKLSLKVVQLDVTDERSVKNAIQSITTEASTIDLLVNNAGYGLGGAFEDLELEEIKDQFETNLFGLIRTTQAVLPIMRKQKSGIIVNISSGAGRMGYPSRSAYVSTKFAVEGLTESMSYELEPFGIKVVLVEPGFVKSKFSQAMVNAKKSQDPNSPYLHLMQKMTTINNQLERNGSTPDDVANIVLTSSSSKNPNLRYLVGRDIEEWVKSKNSMTDAEFHDMMMKGMSN